MCIHTICGVGFELKTSEPLMSIQQQFIINHYNTIVSNISRFSELENYVWLQDECLMSVPDTTRFAEQFQCFQEEFEYSFWELFCFVISHETLLKVEYYEDDFGKAFILQPYDNNDLSEEYKKHAYPLLSKDKIEKGCGLSSVICPFFEEVNSPADDVDIHFVHHVMDVSY